MRVEGEGGPVESSIVVFVVWGGGGGGERGVFRTLKYL